MSYVETPETIAPPGLVWAFRFQGDGSAEPLPADRPLHLGGFGSDWLWAHFDLVDSRTRQWLTTNLDVAPDARNFLVSADAHQQMHVANGCIYGAFIDFSRKLGEAGDESGLLRFIATEHYVISGRRHTLQAADATRRQIEEGRKLLSAAALLESVVEHVADAVDNLMEGYAVDLDDIEERIIAVGSGDERQRLGRLRRAMVRHHRQLNGLRTMFHRLERDGTSGLNPALRLATGKLAQRLDALDHGVIAMLERARLLQEEVASKLTEETNRHLHILSIVTALFLPPTLTAGVFGMNTRGMPWTETDGGFWLSLGLCVATSLLIYWLLRRSGIVK